MPAYLCAPSWVEDEKFLDTCSPITAARPERAAECYVEDFHHRFDWGLECRVKVRRKDQPGIWLFNVKVRAVPVAKAALIAFDAQLESVPPGTSPPAA